MRTTMGYTYMSGGSTVSPYVCGVQPIAMAHALYTINLDAVPSQTVVRVYVVRRCRLTLSKSVLKASTASTLETIIC